MTDKWDDVSQIETEGVKIQDAQQGNAILIRQFKFVYSPTVKKKPTKAQILTKDYIKYLENVLWADNLELITEPRVHIHKSGFIVFAPCKPKRGNIFPYEALQTIDKPLEKRLQANEDLVGG